MDPRFARLDSLFQAARRLPLAERRAFLETATPDDAPLREEVEHLLAALDAAPEAEPTPVIAGLVPGIWDEAACVPDHLGEFRILRRLASGGMGVVYEAEQGNPRRRVALKVLQPGAASEEGRRRFGREAEILARLQHPGIAQVHVFGTASTAAGDSPFLAMELVHGVPLNVHGRGLDTRGRLLLLAKVCDAVAHAHANGVIHRDLKPSNILVTAEGEPKVLDFGVARLLDADTALRTRTGQVIGTLAYMSPEQATGDVDRVDTRSDVYSLGVLGYELLCGRLPHEIGSGSLADGIRRIVEEEPPEPSSLDRSLRGDVSLILRKALAKEPARRYEGAAALAEDIRRHLRDEPIVARAPTATYQIRKFVMRHRALVGGVAATIVTLVVGLILALTAAEEEERQRRRADRNAADARWATSKALMEAAASDLQATAGQAARGRLERVAPEHRGWEWRYLSARVDASSRTVPVDWAPTAIVFDRAAGAAGFLDPRGVALAEARTGARTGPDVPKRKWQRVFRLGGTPAAVGNEGSEVYWLRLDSGTAAHAKLGPRISAAAGTEDGSMVAVCVHGGVGYSQIHIRDTATGEKVAGFRGDAVEMTCLAFSPDGRRLAAAGFYLDIHILDIAKRTEVGLLHGHSGGIRALEFSPDGRLLVSGADDKTVVLWRLEDGAILQRWAAHEGEVHAVAWSPDGTRIASGDALGAIRVWDVEAGTCEHVLQGHVHGVMAVAFRDERTLVSAGPGGIREWHVAPGRDPGVLRYHAGRSQGNPFAYVYAVAFSPDGSLLASGAWDMTVRLVDTATNDLLATLPAANRVVDVGFGAGGREVVAVAAGGTAQAWDADTGLPLAGTGSEKPVPNSATSPDGRLRATVTARGRCEVRSLPDRKILAGFDAHKGAADAVAFDAAGERIATGGLDRFVRVWEARSGRMLLELQGHRDRVYAVAFHPDGSLLASGANDNTIRLWDLERGIERLELRGHENYVHGLAFSPDGETLASASGDNTVRLWTTLPMREQRARANAARAARARMAPAVDALFGKLADARAVADAIRADPSLAEADRRAALHLLLLRGGGTR